MPSNASNHEIEIKTTNRADGEINMPGSKSITNRTLILASLAKGSTHLKNALFSDDTIYVQKALKLLGINIKSDERISEIKVLGASGKISNSKAKLYLGNAGTGMRFLTALTTLGKGEYTITGNTRMEQRPIGDLVDALKLLGADIDYLKTNAMPPIQVNGQGMLLGGKTKLSGRLSSQYLSALLLVGPYTKNGIDIEVIGKQVSKPYIDLTLNLMNDFGIEYERERYSRYIISGGQEYKGIEDYTIEGDVSNASYFFGAAAITNGRIRVNNIKNDTKQGDIRLLNLLEAMGCKVVRGSSWVEVSKTDKKRLRGIDVDMHDISDVVQTLAVIALFAEGKTHIKNVYNMRIKETDRLKALHNELIKLGAGVVEGQDSITIIPQKKYHGAIIETYDDHRMAMSFSLAGLKISNVIIKDANCVSKTFPEYFDYLKKIT